MSLVNLTPHPIHLYRGRPVEKGPDETIPPSGKVARVATIPLGTDGHGFELVEYGYVDDLPQPAPGVWYVVSLVVALASQRGDIVAPYGEIRNTEGTVIGCNYLQRVV